MKKKPTAKKSKPRAKKPKKAAARGAMPMSAKQAGAKAASSRVEIFAQLQTLFTEDHKPGHLVRPETVLGKFPLGYKNTPLNNFYDLFVNPTFGVTITTGSVGTDGTVDDLMDAIIAQGGS